MVNKSLNHIWNDVHWYFAFLLAIIFWLIYGLFFQPFQLSNIFESYRTLIFPVIAYPVLEEIVFRGWLQAELIKKSTFQRKFFSLSNANILTSVIFAILHLFNHAPIWAFLIFFPSLVFGYFRDRYQAILPSIVLHIFYNAGFLILFP